MSLDLDQLNLVVADMDASVEFYRALGHPRSQPPYDAFWGSRYAIVIDPDGNRVGLMSAPDPSLRSAPPDL